VRIGGKPISFKISDKVGIWTLGYTECLSRKTALRYSVLIKAVQISATSELTQSMVLVLFLNPKMLEGRRDRCSRRDRRSIQCVILAFRIDSTIPRSGGILFSVWSIFSFYFSF